MALQKRYRIIHTARLILEQNGEVLFLAQTKQNGNGFSLPGGKIQGIEFAKEGLIRETKEEIGIEVKKKQLRLQHVTYKKLKSSIEIIFFFYTDVLTGIPMICEPEKFKEIKWFLPKDYPAKMPPVIKETLLRMHDGKNYTEFPKNKKTKPVTIKPETTDSSSLKPVVKKKKKVLKAKPGKEIGIQLLSDDGNNKLIQTKKKKKPAKIKSDKKIQYPLLTEAEFAKIVQDKKKKKSQSKKKIEIKNKKEDITELPTTQTI